MITIIANQILLYSINIAHNDFFSAGPEVKITGLGGRLVVTTVLFLNVLLLGHYTSNLTSALTVGPPLPPHRNLEDVYNDKSLTFGFVKGSATVSNFQVMDQKGKRMEGGERENGRKRRQGEKENNRRESKKKRYLL